MPNDLTYTRLLSGNLLCTVPCTINCNLIIDPHMPSLDTRNNPTSSNMSGDMAAVIADPPKLRTYSHRDKERTLTSSLPVITNHKFRHTKSLTGTASQPTRRDIQTRGCHIPPSSRRERAMSSGSSQNRKSPTDLFFEMIASSAPELAQRQQDDETNNLPPSIVVEHDNTPHCGGSANEVPDITTDNKGEIGTQQVHEVVKGKGEDQEDSDDGDSMMELPIRCTQPPTNETLLGSDHHLPLGLDESATSLTTSPKSGVKQVSPTSCGLVDKNPKIRGRFLSFNKRPTPHGFKTVHKRRASQEKENINFKVAKRIGDGFEGDEARPSPYWKRRRIANGELHIGHLELTQKGAATQKIQGPTWLRGQKKMRPATNISLWNRRQYFGSSQFQIDSQDPLEPFEANTEPQTEHEVHHDSHKGRRFNQDILDDDVDEVIELLIIPPDDVEDGSSQIADEDIDNVDLLGHPGNMDKQGSQIVSNAHDDEVDLIISPRTDTREPDDKAAPRGRIGF